MLVEAEKLTKVFRTGMLYKHETRAVVRASLCVNHKDLVGVVGPSGAGKTTLGLLLSGLIKPDGGQIRMEGRDIRDPAAGDRKQLRHRIQIIFQHPESTFNPRWTLRQSIAEPFRVNGIPFSEDELSRHIERVGLETGLLSRYPSQASGGELQRLSIARTMVLNPALVILDEPTSMLDAVTRARIIRLLQRIHDQTGVAYILISHDRDLVRIFCTRVYEMEQGRLQEES